MPLLAIPTLPSQRRRMLRAIRRTPTARSSAPIPSTPTSNSFTAPVPVSVPAPSSVKRAVSNVVPATNHTEDLDNITSSISNPLPTTSSPPVSPTSSSPKSGDQKKRRNRHNLHFASRRFFPLYVSNATLRNATDNGLPKLQSRLFGRVRREVLVEAAPFSRADSLFFAPFTDQAAQLDSSPIPTEFAAVPPSPDTDHLVCAAHDFEIRLVGMHVTPHDGPLSMSNQLLLYSVAERDMKKQSDGQMSSTSMIEPSNESTENDDEEYDGFESIHSELSSDQRKRRARRNRMNQREKQRERKEPNPHISDKDDPTIHYDPVQDGHDVGTAPNTFRPVPGRKALLIRHAGASEGARMPSVAIRFTVMEIDEVTDAQRKAVEKIGGVLNGTAKAVPFGKLISPMVGGVTAAGQAGLDTYAKPDHVISKDVEFPLLEALPSNADPDSERSASESRNHKFRYADNYLRYGYYFFLSKKVDARLYAQTDTSSQSVPLLLRRVGPRADNGSLGERQFFPMTGISYVAVKVTPGVRPGWKPPTARDKFESLERLEDILNMNQAMEMLAGRQR